jgi:hypothetical protein
LLVSSWFRVSFVAIAVKKMVLFQIEICSGHVVGSCAKAIRATGQLGSRNSQDWHVSRLPESDCFSGGALNVVGKLFYWWG